MFRHGALRAFLLLACLALLPGAAAAKTFTYRVRHLHTLGSCQGRLTVGEREVRYDTTQRNHARIWSYTQLRRVDSASLRRLTLVTLEDQILPMPGDKDYNFELLDGDADDELLNFLLERVGRAEPPTPPDTPPGGRYELAAKHLHFLGGCHGALRITPNFVEFATDHRDARLWKYLDIKLLEVESAYKIRIHTYEDQMLLFGLDKVFTFELKEPLEPTVYEFLRRRLDK